MDSNKYFISDYVDQISSNTANIARRDIEFLLEKFGFNKIQFKNTRNKNIFRKLNYILQYIKTAIDIPIGSTVFFAYPIFPTYTKIIHYILSRRKGIQLIHFIHDLDGIRDNNPLQLKKDIRFIAKNDNFITLSKTMDEYFKKIHPQVRSTFVHFIAYLISNPPSIQRELKNEVAFAGQLDKSGFVHKLSEIPEIQYFLYGECKNTIKENTNINYEGVISSRELPSFLKGSFGLVWDGDCLETCCGGNGKYLEINLPHKISLYILAGIPIIIWDQAAVASTILENKIGFSVSSLYDIPMLIKNMKKAEYDKTTENIRKLQHRILNGEDLKMALDYFLSN